MIERMPNLETVPPPKDEVVVIISEDDLRITVQIAHNSIYADPNSECTSPVVDTLYKEQRGPVGATCKEGHEVQVDATHLLTAANKLRIPADQTLVNLVVKETGVPEIILQTYIRCLRKGWMSLGETERLVKLREFAKFKKNN